MSETSLINLWQPCHEWCSNTEVFLCHSKTARGKHDWIFSLLLFIIDGIVEH